MKIKILLTLALLETSLFAQTDCPAGENHDRCKIEKLEQANQKLEQALVLLHNKFDILTKHLQNENMNLRYDNSWKPRLEIRDNNGEDNHRFYADGGVAHDGDATIYGKFFAKKEVDIDGAVQAKSNVTVHGDLVSKKGLKVANTLEAEGEIIAKKEIKSDKGLNINNIKFKYDTSWKPRIQIEDEVGEDNHRFYADGGVAHDGEATIYGNINAKQDLNVSGKIKASKFSWGSVKTTGWLNNWDQKVNHSVAENCVMVGLYSEHQNSSEDRRWKIKYRCFE